MEGQFLNREKIITEGKGILEYEKGGKNNEEWKYGKIWINTINFTSLDFLNYTFKAKMSIILSHVLLNVCRRNIHDNGT